MNFIQCKDSNDCEKILGTMKAGFVSSDHRVYEEIEFWDDASSWYIPAKTILALYNLQTTIEHLTEGDYELFMGDLKSAAKELDDAFKKAIEEIRFQPIKLSRKNL